MEKPLNSDNVPMLPGLELQPLAEAGISSEVASRLSLYTGEMLMAKAPATYNIVAKLINEGLSDAAIARAMNIHQRTAAAVRLREISTGSRIDYVRAQGAKLKVTAMRVIDEINDRLSDVDACKAMTVRDLSYALDRCMHYAQLLDDQPTERVQNIISKGQSLIMRKLLSGDVIDVTPEMHSLAQNFEACESEPNDEQDNEAASDIDL